MTQPLPSLKIDPARARAVATVQLPKRRASFAQVAFGAAAIAIPLITIIPGLNILTAVPAMAASFGFDMLSKSAASRDEKLALKEYYAPYIAQQLGIDSRNVSNADLELAASVNPSIAHVLHKVRETEASQLMTSALASAGGAVVGSFIPATAAAIKIAAAGIAGSMAGGVLGSWLTSPDALKNPQVILENLIETRAHGTGIAPVATMMLRVAQNSELQAAIKAKTGTEYYNLSPEQQGMLMTQFPRIAEYAVKDATFLNNGGDAKALMFILPEKDAVKSSWTNRVSQPPEQAIAQR